tara:strand:+ start:2044 stop:2199 length:156 start_codon:yes stop_codon:yes gene_type:complete
MIDVILVFVAFFLISIIIIALPVLWMMAKELGSILRTAPPLQGPYFNDESE